MKVVGLGILLTLMVLGLLPFALIARSRATQSPLAPQHLILDMDKQPRGKAQRATPLFADGRFMRPQVAGTVAQEDLMLKSEILNDSQTPGLIANLDGKTSMLLTDASAYAAVMQGRIRPANMTDAAFNQVQPPKAEDAAIAADTTFYVKRIPGVFTVSEEFLYRGQERFNIYCAPCHGEDGHGTGPVAQRAAALRMTPNAIGGWADPVNLIEAKIGTRSDGHIFNTITNGIRNMPAYDKQISVADRWAIVGYVRALQRSQNAPAPAAAAAP